mmetsp:Transcript_69891/g.194363  ORF Transcript_69891/g.194363 Transcript_69891/m.194363 type:complete len:345 (-) Transcript_69891:149-1183(-)|eukprot:CAMPEP_0117590408 /NCGR_PEP_ID=MMETSP0784-20121206/70960_1 /TAXON_ID=39447 /ORGANISM="" /LENGTH=344 /DNA_ID=CAMNT_0005392015 /DNA_START=29 /DNA_END=1063 /DNA_ORIENTATION=+
MFRLCIVLSVLFVAVTASLHDRSYYEAKFIDWLNKFEVKLENGAHFVKALENFITNDDHITEHNSKKSTYQLGHNKFSHMSVDEWREAVHLGISRPENRPKASKVHTAPAGGKSSLPSEVDWVSSGAVTDVKDQGQCGSCWSFSTTGSLEGAYKLKTGTLKSFSEQNLVDCDTLRNGGGDLGCNGGLYDTAYEWIQTNGGLCSEEDYPYISGTTKSRSEDGCNTSCSKDAAVTPVSYTDVETNSDEALMSALAQQPVSVAIQADQRDFQLYSSGVFTASCGTNLDHAVLAVGYGTLDGEDYYKVKNSWGTGWGMDGYILMGRGDSYQKEGQCGILAGPPAYPTL